MTGTLPAAARKKLARVLGMLGSDSPGERDAAALAAARLVRSAGLTWLQVLSPRPADHPPPELRTWRQTARDCLARPGSLRPWEAGFLRDLSNFQRLSTKQRYILKEIADRVLGRERP